MVQPQNDSQLVQRRHTEDEVDLRLETTVEFKWLTMTTKNSREQRLSEVKSTLGQTPEEKKRHANLLISSII
jgi:hypothetical protein